MSFEAMILDDFQRMSIRQVKRQPDFRVVEKTQLSILERFSPALLVEVLCHLPYLYLLRCRLVCRDFRKMIDHCAELQLTIEFAAAGYCRTNARVSASVALQQFRAFQRIYRNPKAHKCLELNLEAHIAASYKHRDVEFAKSKRDRYGDYVISQTAASSYRLKLVDVLYLGSDPLGQLSMGDRFHTHVFCESWEVAAVEPYEDLLVMRERADPEMELQKDTLYFLSLRHGTPHPKRPETTLVVDNLTEVHCAEREWLLCSATGPSPGMWYPHTHLYHWPTGELNWIWPMSGKAPFTDRGFIIGEYALIPKWLDEPDEEYFDAWIEVWRIPPLDNLDFWPQHIANFEVELSDEPDRRAFSIYPLQNCRMPFDNRRGFAPAQTTLILSWTQEHHEHYLPLSMFLPDGDFYGTDKIGDEPVEFPWSEWNPQRNWCDYRGPNCGRDYFDVMGFRFFFPDMIADLNQYDAVNNIYGFEPIRNPVDGKERADPSYVLTASIGEPLKWQLQTRSWRKELNLNPDSDSDSDDSESDPVMLHRVVPFLGKERSRYESRYLIEEDDGPKIVEIDWEWQQEPAILTYYALTENTGTDQY